MANNDHYFQGKVSLITGGSSGIGLALAKDLAAQGARVWIAGRRREKLESAKEEIQKATGVICGILEVDVADAKQVQKMVEKVEKHDGTPDLLINSAGITHPGYVQELDLAVFREAMEVNYLGTVNTVKAALPGMLERGSGSIVNISSAAGFGGVFGYSAYGASKYAVRGFSDVLRAEMKPHGIYIAVVFPADTDTPQLAYEQSLQPGETKIMNAKAKTLSAGEVSKSILKDIKREKYIILPGIDIKFFYHLNDFLGNLKYVLMDWWIRDARRRLGKD